MDVRAFGGCRDLALFWAAVILRAGLILAMTLSRIKIVYILNALKQIHALDETRILEWV